MDVLRPSGVDPPFGGTARPATPALAGEALAELVAKQIVPRMLLAHRLDSPELAHTLEVQAPPPNEDVARLADVAVAMDDTRALELVESRLRSGLSYESVLLDFIAAAARMLGEGWSNEERTFADVTIGLATLHRTVTSLRHRLRPAVS